MRGAARSCPPPPRATRSWSGCVRDPRVPLAHPLGCSGPQHGLNTKHKRRLFRRPPDGSKHLEVVKIGIWIRSWAVCLVPRFSHRPSPASITRLGNRRSLCFATPPSIEEPPFTDGRLVALPSRLLNGLGVRKVGCGPRVVQRGHQAGVLLVNRHPNHLQDCLNQPLRPKHAQCLKLSALPRDTPGWNRSRGSRSARRQSMRLRVACPPCRCLKPYDSQEDLVVRRSDL